MRYAGHMKRYQVNLTDHAFWLGTYAFDYCLEFLDFGAIVSREYRHIPPSDGAGAASVLLSEEELGFEYTDMDVFLGELRRFIEEPAYRQQKEALFRAKKLLVTEDEFVANLEKILCEDRSNYPIRVFDVDLRIQEVQHAQLWERAKREEGDSE